MTKSINLYLFFLVLVLIGLAACSKDDDFGEQIPDDEGYKYGNGVFVVNEGNFGFGNGSLSFLNLDSLLMYNDVFYHANLRPLGDVPLSITTIGDTAWVVVNNSSKIELIDLAEMSSTATISGLVSPRFVLPVSNQKAYISDFVESKISIINTRNFNIEGKIDIGCSSEQMLLANGKVLAAFWSNYGFSHLENNKLMVIDASTDQLIDSVIVGKEPNSMVLDKQGKLWVLCSGGFASEEKPSLWQIDPGSLDILSVFIFPEINTSPISLCIDEAGEHLYFLNQGIFQMSISDITLPTIPLITEDAHLFYSLAVDPKSNEIFATDAIDYQQRGLVLRYQPNGTFVDSFRAGIIPGAMVFR